MFMLSHKVPCTDNRHHTLSEILLQGTMHIILMKMISTSHNCTNARLWLAPRCQTGHIGRSRGSGHAPVALYLHAARHVDHISRPRRHSAFNTYRASQKKSNPWVFFSISRKLFGVLIQNFIHLFYVYNYVSLPNKI